MIAGVRPYPIVEYAHLIHKNTAEFTVKDLAGFMRWWVGQPERKDLLNMSRKYDAAMKSRLTSEQVADIEQADDAIAEDMLQQMGEDECQIICEMGLTQVDIDALLWALNVVNGEYALLIDDPMGNSLLNLKESLEALKEESKDE